ncbi:LLM class flavin-dependent oxidoreductase [Streptomyces sp. NPDC002677]|uniref:LLM class flavin-dependent oxidoreductase n=1 Tax=Streptomyces sp. 900105755 TaxID=3154389 RepID=A0ABV1TUU5_9ACTN
MSPQETSGTIGVLLPRDIHRADLIAFAQEADAYGFDELWVVEDLGYRGGPVQAATVLSCTRRIRVGVGLLPAGARNVAFAAMEAATLAQLHPGRLDLAVGHGMPDWMRSVGSWPASPLTLLGEYIHTLKTLLAGRTADTDGRYIRLDGLRLDPSVVPEHVPDIFAGVRGPKSLALAGEVADGTLLAEPVTPEYVRQALTSINPQRPHRLAAYNIAVVDDDPHAALLAARPALQPLGDPDWAPHIVPLGFHDELAALRRTSKSARDFARAMPEEWAERLLLAGTPGQVRARVQDLFESGVTTAVLSPVGPDYRSALANLAKVL